MYLSINVFTFLSNHLYPYLYLYLYICIYSMYITPTHLPLTGLRVNISQRLLTNEIPKAMCAEPHTSG